MKRSESDNPKESLRKRRDGKLYAWDEIAEYVGRSVRTLQRWEEFYDFPLHRVGSGIYAMADEIEEWLNQPLTYRAEAGFATNQRWTDDLRKDSKAIIDTSRKLRNMSAQSRADRLKRRA